MGLFQYLVQGFGWEIGRTAAREGLHAVGRPDEDAPRARPPSKSELRRIEREKRRADAERVKIVERKKAEIEAELARLKKRT